LHIKPGRHGRRSSNTSSAAPGENAKLIGNGITGFRSGIASPVLDFACAKEAAVQEMRDKLRKRSRATGSQGNETQVFAIISGSSVLLLGIALLSASCGYHAHSAVTKFPAGIQSLGIPTFRNLTAQYKIEQVITSAVLKEFTLRTRQPVNSSSTGMDSVLLGEIRSVNSIPVTFGTQTVGSQTFGSAFLVTVRVGVKLMRVKDSVILWQNDDYLYRERYVLNTEVRDFFSEENPALERLAKDFAASLASTILDRPKP
jgi:hypothetical protein